MPETKTHQHIYSAFSFTTSTQCKHTDNGGVCQYYKHETIMTNPYPNPNQLTHTVLWWETKFIYDPTFNYTLTITTVHYVTFHLCSIFDTI